MILSLVYSFLLSYSHLLLLHCATALLLFHILLRIVRFLDLLINRLELSLFARRRGRLIALGRVRIRHRSRTGVNETCDVLQVWLITLLTLYVLFTSFLSPHRCRHTVIGKRCQRVSVTLSEDLPVSRLSLTT